MTRFPVKQFFTVAISTVLLVLSSVESVVAVEGVSNGSVEQTALQYPDDFALEGAAPLPPPPEADAPASPVKQSRQSNPKSYNSIHPHACRSYSRQEPSLAVQFRRGMQARHWGYPEYFCERPFGSCNYLAGSFMVANGLRDQMVLYNYDFGVGEHGDQLSLRGLAQLEKIVQRVPLAEVPILIQGIPGDPELNARRQEHVLKKLAEFGMPLDPEMVVVGKPRARGLDGAEAVIVYSNLLEQTRVRGNVGIETSAIRDLGFGSDPTGAAPVQPVFVP